MKRAWNLNPVSPYGVAQSPSTQSQSQTPSSWLSDPSHPYSSAYNNIPNPFSPSALHDTAKAYENVYGNGNGDGQASGSDHLDKRARIPTAGEGGSDGSDDDEEDDDEEGGGDGEGGTGTDKVKRTRKGTKQKVKLTRGSKACIACRKIKMRCIPDDTNPGEPCKRCKSGGHECLFEESNRGKRSTRKNEALAARIVKMEAALRSIGSALSNLDQPSLNSFSTALHTATSDPDAINLITSYTSASAVPTLAVAMNRQTYNPSYDPRHGEDSSHTHSQPPLSPRLHSLPDNVLSPLGLLAEASLSSDGGKRRSPGHVNYGMKGVHRPSPLSFGEAGKQVPNRPGSATSNGSYRMATSDVRGGGESEGQTGRGVASQDYFKPAVSISAAAGAVDERIPELLTMVSREEIGELFGIFFDHVGLHVLVLYREFHTPDLVLQRSQFLCTVICAIAARYYTKRNDLHSQLSAFAKRLAFEVPSRGYKSVEVVQAYLLLSMWTLGPEKTFEQDRTWLMLGMAIRMATDLNLHRKSQMSNVDTDEGRARDLEILNRERCWLHCFILDRSLSAQMGKPYSLREDYIIRNACEAAWPEQRFTLPSDKALAAYVVLQQIMSRAIDSIYSSTTTVSGLRQDCDYMMIVRSAHEELKRWLTEWAKRDNHPQYVEFYSRAQFYFAYHSLVLYSFGLENALERSKMDISFFLTNVYEFAARVCTVVKEEFTPKGYLPYLPDSNFVMCSYALLSLLKLLKPELKAYHDSEDAIFKLVTEVADILEQSAVDPSHQPAIYAAFIREIVRKTREAPIAHNVKSSPGSNGHMNQNQNPNSQIDPSLFDLTMLNDQAGSGNGNNHSWPTGEILSGAEGNQFTYVPQGGDMMILPSAAGPSESLMNSPTAAFLHAFPSATGNTPQATTSTGWPEYLPTFMSADGFDGWDGSMLLPGFGGSQITLGGGLLHSQFGSGIITPAQHTPSQSRAQSRAPSRAQTPLR